MKETKASWTYAQILARWIIYLFAARERENMNSVRTSPHRQRKENKELQWLVLELRQRPLQTLLVSKRISWILQISVQPFDCLHVSMLANQHFSTDTDDPFPVPKSPESNMPSVQTNKSNYWRLLQIMISSYRWSTFTFSRENRKVEIYTILCYKHCEY